MNRELAIFTTKAGIRMIPNAAIGTILLKLVPGEFEGTLAIGSTLAALGLVIASRIMDYQFEIGQREPIGRENAKHIHNENSPNLIRNLQYLAGLMLAPAIENWGPEIMYVISELSSFITD